MTNTNIEQSVAASGQFVPELWAKEVVHARESKLVMPNRVARYDAEFKNGGDILRIPQMAALSAASVGSYGAITLASHSETPLALTVDQWIYAAVEVEDLAKVQSSYNMLKEYAKEIGYALKVNLEDYLLGLYSTLTQSVGTAGVPVTDPVLLNSILKLDEADTPEEDRTIIMRPASKATLLQLDKFVDASKTGYAKSAAMTGMFGDIYGIPIFFSNRVISSTGVRNLVFHKDAFMCAIQKDVSTYEVGPDRTQIAHTIVGHMMYGAIEKRDTDACTLLT
jgi:hypothetical protein